MLKSLRPAALTVANPVLTAEFRHQRYIIQTSRAGWFWIGLAMLLVIPSLLVSLVYSVLALWGQPLLADFYRYPASVHAFAGVLLVVINLALYPVVTLVGLSLANSSITREKQNHTWSLLRLTQLRNEQIVLGKWGASIRALNGDYIMVLLVRVGLAAHYLIVLLPAWQNDLSVPVAAYFLIAALFIVLQALLDAALTAAVGVVSALPDETVGVVSGSSALVVRLLLGLLVAAWFLLLMRAAHAGFAALFGVGLMGLAGTLVALLALLALGRFLLD